MAAFKFRLASVLRLRVAQRDQRRAELARAYQAQRILQQKTEQISDQLVEIKDHLRHATQPGRVDVDSLLNGHRFELRLRAQQQQLMNQAVQIEKEIERRRALLIEADKQVRVLEKLRDRQLQAYQRQQGLRETAQMDEIAGRRRRVF